MDSEPTYTVYIRLPFPRGSFVDPPPVNWDVSKDEALWTILSGVSKTEIDWNELAARFEVTVEFLLQQVTYLTERHASQVKAQMRKATSVARGGSSAPSPVPGSESTAAAEAMRRTGSGQGHGRTPSSLSIRKDVPVPKNDGSIPGTPKGTTLGGRPQASRASSTGTAVPVVGTGSLRLKQPPANRPASPQKQQRTRLTSLPISPTPTPTTAAAPADPPSPGPAESSSAASSSSSASSPAQSRIIRRPPRFQPHQDGASSFADEDDEAEPAFLPFKANAKSSAEADRSGQYTDPSATLRGDPRDFAKRLSKGSSSGKERIHKSQTSDSSASSAAMVSNRRSVGDRRPPGPLSPRRTAELAGRSPGGKGKGYSREGSDGTPSMGSSFSDLDDASVTQSALEEALASRMQDGGTIGSRMSTTISNAFKSRYLPKTNRP